MTELCARCIVGQRQETIIATTETCRKITVTDDQGDLNVVIETNDRSLARWLRDRELDENVAGAQLITIDRLTEIANAVSVSNKLRFIKYVKEDFGLNLEDAKNVADEVWKVRHDKTDEHQKSLQDASRAIAEIAHDFVTPDTPEYVMELLRKIGSILKKEGLH